MRRTFLLFALVTAVALAGCIGDDGASTGTSETTPADPGPSTTEDEQADDENGTTTLADRGGRVPILRVEYGLVGYHADALCTAGGAPNLEARENPILPGANRLEVHVTTAPDSRGVWTGAQLGYVVDGNGADHAQNVDADITWLPPVHQGNQTSTVDVPTDAVETDGPNRWDFYLRINPADADEACYTGVGVGELRVAVDAVADP